MLRNKPWNIVLSVGVSIFIILSISLYTQPVYVYSDLAESGAKLGRAKLMKATDDDKPEKPKPKQNKRPKSQSKPVLKRILYWNELYGSKNYGFCCGRGPYKKFKCTNDACYTSKDRTDDLSTFDAIVFHGRNLNKDDLPPTRYPHQYYIFLIQESPAYPGNINIADWNGYFNLTMTYRADSDIFMPYGQVSVRSSKTQNNQVPWKSKTKLAAWFVSHCVTLSKRENLVNKLVENMPDNSVDIYGYCGPKRCPRENETKDSCWDKVENNYKFYLSLENSICKDYVTEKMFEALKHNVIPIVLGGANYSATFPVNSFINMQDFSSMKELASYLLTLGGNKSEYMKYFKWKEEYEILNSKHDFNQAHCRLCQFLHENEGKTRIVNNLAKWWVEDSSCSL